MALRIETPIGILLSVAAMAGAQEIRFEARHKHLRGAGAGTLTIGEGGIAFEEAKKRHSFHWAWDEIQQLILSPDALHVLTYEDSKWQLGRDRQYDFEAASDETSFA